MNMIAVIQALGRSKQVVWEMFDEAKVAKFDFDEELQKLLAFGQEGYRQVWNYFGEEFFDKKGHLKKAKFWRFVYQDYHKLKILYFLMEPLLLNQLQKFKDSVTVPTIIVFAPGLVDNKSYDGLGNICWLNWPEAEQIADLDGLKPPVPAEQFVRINRQLFPLPVGGVIQSTHAAGLQEDIEQWRKILYKLGIEA